MTLRLNNFTSGRSLVEIIVTRAKLFLTSLSGERFFYIVKGEIVKSLREEVVKFNGNSNVVTNIVISDEVKQNASHFRVENASRAQCASNFQS